MKTIPILLLAASVLIGAEPTREGGLTVHMLPDRVAKINAQHGGFTITNPANKEPGTTYAEPKQLVTYFLSLPAEVQWNGIWIVLTNPAAYSETEQAKLKSLVALCAGKKIPLFTCRASELPKGWKRAE